MWPNFFVAAAGASAALAGLVFVAVSLNIQRILQFQNLPARAAAAISALILILVSSIAALIPQNTTPLGAEILGFASLAWLVQGVSSYRALAAKRASKRPPHEFFVEAVLGQIQILPFVAGGILLLTGSEMALYWVATGVIAVFICSVFNAWILLVEILR